MLTMSEAQRRAELFLTGQMLEALRAVEYELPSFDTELHDVESAAVARACVEIRHVRGASDATYLINAFGEELLMRMTSTRRRSTICAHGVAITFEEDRQGGVLNGPRAYFHDPDGTVLEFIDLTSYAGNRF